MCTVFIQPVVPQSRDMYKRLYVYKNSFVFSTQQMQCVNTWTLNKKTLESQLNSQLKFVLLCTVNVELSALVFSIHVMYLYGRHETMTFEVLPAVTPENPNQVNISLFYFFTAFDFGLLGSKNSYCLIRQTLF